ncbi:hypothetical protein, conserved [Trypanosoma brucei gambiense DAL972]|uniref:Vesicle transport v-SNARE N-terminal domain-containing protein n=2 Tax=Trypanosoma brucei TaxID=5691 RepID=C9ZVI1_TRYB9|nr:hypothetical protein, conserved [Trypanosoma brucei gambiense DAL972]RHW70771.1 Vesicle transport v-SNARE protein N-terminus [Trypanosoma brucei equiperdum]CBH13419.1 hypothetical protein, conserved [Trypanosoma brucei gambiense DAL972]|eukprot:XP_011775696.1 hypothetical protein, conserved [Trypanosoma brucei gambiense DAL972]
MSSDLLREYENDFNETLKEANDVASRLQESLQRSGVSYQAPPAAGPQSRSQQCHSLQQSLTRLRELITNMSYESNEVEPASAKEEVKRRLEDYRGKLVALEKQLSRLRQESREADRTDLLGNGREMGDDGGSMEEHARMLGTTTKLKEGTGALQKAEALLHGTNELGLETLSVVRGQTETMKHIHGVVIDVDDDVTESRRIVHRMHQVARKQKLIMAGVIGMLVFTFLIIVFWK